MIFAGISDLHFTDKKPKYRSDASSLATCFDKFRQVLDLCIMKETRVLVIGGDVFDYPTTPRYVVTGMQNLLSKYDIEILVIPGQHDLRYHAKGLDNTPLGNIISAGMMTLLVPHVPYVVNGIEFVGQGWEEKVECKGDILVTHQMVTKKGPLWPGQTDFISAAGLLNQHKGFKCVISGDNHKPHSFKSRDGRIQINSGSVMRSSKSQVDHKPLVWFIDTDNWSFKSEELDVKPSVEVFDFSKIATDETKDIARKEAQEKIDAFVDAFDQKQGEKTDFKTVVKRVVEESKPSKVVEHIINEILESVS